MAGSHPTPPDNPALFILNDTVHLLKTSRPSPTSEISDVILETGTVVEKLSEYEYKYPSEYVGVYLNKFVHRNEYNTGLHDKIGYIKRKYLTIQDTGYNATIHVSPRVAPRERPIENSQYIVYPGTAKDIEIPHNTTLSVNMKDSHHETSRGTETYFKIRTVNGVSGFINKKYLKQYTPNADATARVQFQALAVD